MRKKVKKTSRKTLVRNLDKVCGDIVKLRDKGICVVCGSTRDLTSGHLFSRGHFSTRWDIDSNLFCQCVTCNLKHEYDPYPLMKYAELILGKDGLEDLHLRYNTPRQWKDFQLAELLEELKTRLDNEQSGS